MTENNQDDRNEVYIEKRKIDSTTNMIIENKSISLKSNKDSIDSLIKKAEKVLDK